MSNESGFAQDRRLPFFPTASESAARLYQLIIGGERSSERNGSVGSAPDFVLRVRTCVGPAKRVLGGLGEKISSSDPGPVSWSTWLSVFGRSFCYNLSHVSECDLVFFFVLSSAAGYLT
jgi:hypothetical protein